MRQAAVAALLACPEALTRLKRECPAEPDEALAALAVDTAAAAGASLPELAQRPWLTVCETLLCWGRLPNVRAVPADAVLLDEATPDQLRGRLCRQAGHLVPDGPQPQTPAELVAYLQERPDLAVELVDELRVLRRWDRHVVRGEQLLQTGLVDLRDPQEELAVLQLDEVDEVWYDPRLQDGCAPTYDTLEEARAALEAPLRERGWAIAGSGPVKPRPPEAGPYPSERIEQEFLVVELARARVLLEIADERQRQRRKHGDQSRLPDACPVLLGRPGGASPARLAEDVEIPIAARGKSICQTAAEQGRAHFSAILVEEVAEAVGAIGDDAALREELIQVAAVAVQWIEAIDARQADRGGQ